MSDASQFDGLVVFGDSWSDFGIVQSLFFESFGFPMYSPDITSTGRFTTGANFVDFLVADLELSEGAVQNFAVGGARLLDDRTWSDLTGGLVPEGSLPGDFRVDVVAQIERFTMSLDGEDDLSGAAASLLIGGNDILGADVPEGPVDEMIVLGTAFGVELFEGVLEQVETLADAGVGTVFLYTMAGASAFPVTLVRPLNEVQFGEAASESFNAQLLDGLDAIEALGLDAVVVDIGTLMDEVAADFTSFGFRAYLDPLTWDQYTINPDLEGVPFDQIAMLDGVHRTEAYDRIVAQFQYDTLMSDYAVGTVGRDVIRTGEEDDLVLALGNNDLLTLGGGDDVALGGLGLDNINGEAGDDLLAGGSGDDRLTGGFGHDVLVDGAGDDVSFGNGGRDVILDGAGSDIAYGNGGADVFVYTDQALYGGDSSGDLNRFIGGQGNDYLFLRLDAGDAQDFADGLLSLSDLGITAIGIEHVIAVEGLDVPGVLDGNVLVGEADNWGFI